MRDIRFLLLMMNKSWSTNPWWIYALRCGFTERINAV